MNLKNLILVVLVCFFFASCGGGSSKSGENEQYDDVSERDAALIIEYTNSLIDELGRANEWIKSNSKKINTMAECAKKEQKKFPAGTFISSYMGFKDNKVKVPNSLSKEDQAFFSENMTNFRTSFASLRTNVDALKKYYEAEDFKDDKFVKGKVLADSITAIGDLLPKLHSTVSEKIEIVANSAEIVILKTHPLKDAIIAAKGDLASFDRLCGSFYDYSENIITADSLEVAYNNLQSFVESHKDSFQEALTAEKELDSYKRYYKSFEDDALLNARKILRNAKEGKKITNRDFESLRSAYNSLISRYNSFVN